VQNSKGGGLAANFSGSTQVMGVRKTADFLEKATWGFAAALLVLSILASIAVDTKSNERKSRLEGQTTMEASPIPTERPAMPVDHTDFKETAE